jgi:mono/diheme cytochrome c family protein/glucose/arabinose dehydrogenase
MKKNFTITLCLIGVAFFIFQCTVNRPAATIVQAPQEETIKQKPLLRDSSGKIIVNRNPDPAYLSPEESLRSIYVPEGYRLELVANEPMIQEPVAIVWDANGRMYVSQMMTYMQDINGTRENEPVSRIMLLEDVDGDGKMDKSSVYIDSLLLPRMMLCVGRKLLVSETYTNNIWSYEDVDNDGKADRKTQVYGNSTRNTANLEHQRSGLVWNLDNRIYTTYENLRYRYTGDKLEADTMLTASGQWGIGNDNYGRLYFSSAGGENPAYGFQMNPFYGRYEVRGQLDGDFIQVWPVISTPDVQGGKIRLREDSTLNHFTGCCGQSVFRGNALPEDLQGDLIICEPVGRLIRRAKVINRDGVRVLKNAYDKEEFISSTDMNFRPVNSTTGPDGCLYIVDMHRGIIQEGNWTREGSYLRPQIQKRGLDNNRGHGRVYRLVHNGYKPGPKPAMLDQTSQVLVDYLAHPNGWWRDNAQKELVVRGDRSVIPALEKMAATNENHLARIHALWTLEGLRAINKKMLSVALNDADARVRKSAVTISEQFLKDQDPEMVSLLSSKVNDPDADVQLQLAASLAYFPGNESKALLQQLMVHASAKQTVQDIAKAVERNMSQKLYGIDLSGIAEADKPTLLKGREIFQQVCATCHGSDGRGVSIAGAAMPAPPFTNSKRAGNKPALVNILLHGLSGPVDGKTYTDVMVPFGAANDDEWISSIVNYVHFRFRPRDVAYSAITPQEVKKLRDKFASRKTFWTLEELETAEKATPAVEAKANPVKKTNTGKQQPAPKKPAQ